MLLQCKGCNGRDAVALDLCEPCLKDRFEKGSTTPSVPSVASLPPAQTNKTKSSSWVLQGKLTAPNDNMEPIRIVEVDEEIAKSLKPHQKDAVEFIWRNSFTDYNYFENGNQSIIGGCLLAHHMGLGMSRFILSLRVVFPRDSLITHDRPFHTFYSGKTFTSIALLHTAMKSRSMKSKSGKPLCKTALVIAPVNTLTNWKNEIQQWTGDLNKPLKVINLGDLVAGSRPMEISNWKGTGGVLLVGPEMFRALSDDLVKARPDILVLDEAHKMLNNAATMIFKKLIGFNTKRRICLSGTPIQNNTVEYYHFAEFMRPGVIGVEDVEAFKERYE